MKLTRAALLAGTGAGLALSAAALAAAQGPSPPAAPAGPPSPQCAALARPGAVKGLAEATASGAPGYCEIAGVIRPTAGSRIGVVFRLPDRWNGKVLGLGGGGWAGNVRPETAAPGLAAGYATMQTDAGHASANAGDASWSILGPGQPNPDTRADFNWRAIHLMTVSGKAAASAFYGRDPTKAYFQGCSTGGREGLMEVQRFPDDYDGVIAGAPVYDLVVQTSAVLRTQFFHNDAESNLRPEQLPVINAAVLNACDRLDGVEDGLVSDPTACNWDPAELGCDHGAVATCLTDKQVATVRKAYAGVRTRDGAVAAWPLARGGELEWLDRSVGTPRQPKGSNAVTGSGGLQYFIYADPSWDGAKWTPDTDLAKVRGGDFAKDYEAKDPDIRPFLARGGKLILWHGGYDPGPSPLGTLRYYQDVQRVAGPAAAAGVRYFIVPGVYHCGGGPGPDRFDMLAAVDRWVSEGQAPTQVVATNPRTGLSRPLCPYPQVASYRGGDIKAAASFTCAAGARAEAAKPRERVGG